MKIGLIHPIKHVCFGLLSLFIIQLISHRLFVYQCLVLTLLKLHNLASFSFHKALKIVQGYCSAKEFFGDDFCIDSNFWFR